MLLRYNKILDVLELLCPLSLKFGIICAKSVKTSLDPSFMEIPVCIIPNNHPRF